MKVPEFRYSSSFAEAAAAADDLSIVNAFVTGPLLPGMRGCVGSFLSLSEPEGLISGPRSTIPSDTRTRCLVTGDFLYFIGRSSLLVYSN